MKRKRAFTLLLATALLVVVTAANTQAATSQRAVFWNTLGSPAELAASRIGPPVQQISYLYSDWQEAQTLPAVFGGGLFVNHDTQEGWANDGANFFAIDMSQVAVTPAEGAIEFWFQYKYDSATHNTAFYLMMLDQLEPHFAVDYPPQNGIDLSLQWNGWNYSDRKFFSYSLQTPTGSYVDARTAPWTAGPGGPYAFVTDQTMHFALVWDVSGIDGTADTLRLYVDGALAASAGGTWSTDYPFRRYLYIGSLPNRRNWDTYYNAVKGITDDLIIYNYAKTDYGDRFVEGPPPAVAIEDAYTVDEDGTLTVAAPGVLANDVNAAGLLPSVVAPGPQFGALTLNADGSFVYVPQPDYNGSDHWAYMIDDGIGGLSQADVWLTVTPVNDAPIANPDSAATTTDDFLTIAVLANDTDIEGDALIVAAVTNGAHGQVVINPDQSVTYMRDPGFNGSDSFTYTADDQHGGQAIGVVSVTLTPDLTLKPGVTIGENVTIDPSALLGSNVQIGDSTTVAADVRLLNGVTIGDDSTIGADSTLKQNVSVGDGATIGTNVTIDAGVTLGSGLTTGDDVKINRNVAAGDDLTLADGVFIGNGTTLGDAVTLGSGTHILGGTTTIGDGTTIGDNCLIQRNVTIGANVTIGNNVLIRSGAVIADGTVVPDGATVR